MELDHIFICTEPGGGLARVALERLGLRETYRRTHVGQGTANVCYAFENAFLELLWIDDLDALQSPLIQRTKLFERLSHATQPACPFGIAWRLPHTTQQPVPTWDFQPPYLPPHIPIPTALCSEDPTQPMLFMSPGKEPPSAWPDERRKTLQSSSGFTRIHRCTLAHPAPHPDLQVLANQGLFDLQRGPQHTLTVHLKHATNSTKITFPVRPSKP